MAHWLSTDAIVKNWMVRKRYIYIYRAIHKKRNAQNISKSKSVQKKVKIGLRFLDRPFDSESNDGVPILIFFWPLFKFKALFSPLQKQERKQEMSNETVSVLESKVTSKSLCTIKVMITRRTEYYTEGLVFRGALPPYSAPIPLPTALP